MILDEGRFFISFCPVSQINCPRRPRKGKYEHKRIFFLIKIMRRFEAGIVIVLHLHIWLNKQSWFN